MIQSDVMDTLVGDVHITAEQVADANIGTYGGEDYVLPVGRKIEPQLITNNKVRIFDGTMVYCGVRDNIMVNSYRDVEIENGSQGMNRNDIIVRHFEKDEITGYGSAKFVAVKGTPTEGVASDPEIEVTDLRTGALTHDMPLHRVRIEGLNIVAVEPLFNVLMNMSEISSNAIVESGSNARGNYRKYADGTLEMWGIAKNNILTSAAGSCYVSTAVTVTFPIASLTDCFVNANANFSSLTAVWLGLHGISFRSNFTCHAISSFEITAVKTMYIHWRALGTWK